MMVKLPTRKKVDAQFVRSLLDYDELEGILTWRKRPIDMFRADARNSAEQRCQQWNTRYAGKRAGSPGEHGRQIVIGHQHFIEHRVIWLWMTGEWPEDLVDHKDLDPNNNRWRNLRSATHSQNHFNCRAYKNSASGIKGVYWSKAWQKWHATLQANKKRIHVGYFDDFQDAAKAIALSIEQYHGVFGRAS